MATAKTPAKSSASQKTAAKKVAAKAVPAADAPLILKRETVADLQALLKQALKARQSRKVCVA